MLKAVELFAGAGGLAMGVSLAGFKSVAVIERDRWACDTIRENQRRGHPLVMDWNLHQSDVEVFDWPSIEEDVDLIAGGPPCQPFSMGGKHRAHKDRRDLFPATVDIIRALRPRAFLLENVKGLTRSTFANYYQYILLQLEFPEVPKRPKEDWSGHFKRLQGEKSSGERHGHGLTYNVVPTLLNAADYGVPQRRERVFIVGFRSDLGVEWSFPKPTHNQDALLHEQWVTGEYWERHGISKRKRPSRPPNSSSRLMYLMNALIPPSDLPWRTVRDAIAGLPCPKAARGHPHLNHAFQDGAKIYPGHTGSPMDLPAKTLKAGDHGVPGGENMMVLDNGDVRYFTVREAARLQGFPDNYIFHGSWSETMRQLGNAVPVTLSRVVASSVAIQLIEVSLRDAKSRRGRIVA